MKLIEKFIIVLVLIIIVCVVSPAAVYADTDGTEIQITDQPERLVLQLGPQWAGVEFELKTDTGVYPAPVVVNSAGVMEMDLGGSNTYTLSCLASAAAVLNPEPSAEDPSSQFFISATSVENNDDSDNNGEFDNSGEIKPIALRAGIPAKYLIILITGLIVAIGGLASLHYSRRHRKARDYDDEDDFE